MKSYDNEFIFFELSSCETSNRIFVFQPDGERKVSRIIGNTERNRFERNWNQDNVVYLLVECRPYKPNQFAHFRWAKIQWQWKPWN